LTFSFQFDPFLVSDQLLISVSKQWGSLHAVHDYEYLGKED
jgi:hypothetical protein